MNTKQANETVKTLVTGIIVGSIALTTLAVTGCDNLPDSQVAALTSGTATQPDELIAIAGKLAANHNETFMI